jgi:hypothetical protein
MASFKSDVQATRFTTTTAGSNAIIAGPIRLRGIIMLHRMEQEQWSW